MTTVTQVTLTCDVCGNAKDVKTWTFGLDGKAYEIDLCRKDGNALSRVAAESAPGFTFIRLAILSSSTVDQLIPAIRLAALRRKLILTTYIGGYGQYRNTRWKAVRPAELGHGHTSYPNSRRRVVSRWA